MAKIYLIGYSGRTLTDIQRIIGKGLLLDIRLSPKSRKSGFSEKRLREAFGDKYQWVYEFGNENYQGGDVKLYDPDMGIKIIDELAKKHKRIFLMCVCKDGATCHRHTVGELLTQHGYSVQEHSEDDTKERSQ